MEKNKKASKETNKETKQLKKETKEEKVEDRPKETQEEKKDSEKTEKEKPKKIAKEIAIVNGYSLRISPKYSFAICKVIKNKTPQDAIKRLEKVISKKRAIPIPNREVPHQKGKKMAGGKYPIKACKEFIKLLKQLQANAQQNLIENPVITIAKANKASRPLRRFGRRGKRTHVYIEVKDKLKLENGRKGIHQR